MVISDDIQKCIIRLAKQSPIEFSILLTIDADEIACLDDQIGEARQELDEDQFPTDLQKQDADALADWADRCRALSHEIFATIRAEQKRKAQSITSKLEDALAVEEECDGSVDGMLEQINIHSGANTFHIYPEIGPKKVTCHFPGHLYDDAVAAVGRKVEVFGRLKYRSGANFAHYINVTGIELFPPEDELPDWEDLRGMAPNATGDLSSEDFVRGLRDA